MSRRHLVPLYLGSLDPGPVTDEFLARSGTPAQEIIVSTLADLELAHYLRVAGVGADVVSALRSRLLEA